MDHEIIHTEEDVDDLISDIHQLIDEDAPVREPIPQEQPAPAAEAPKTPAQEPVPEEPSEPAPARQSVKLL